MFGNSENDFFEDSELLLLLSSRKCHLCIVLGSNDL
jgi:hypothetical protein